ncbi:IclR family transcriptional regulator [Sphingobium herbicidovorans]|uniref:IclR family transcriptional regulator n=1 Tax=Sphingobium herbicidovorans TaxID=76947 RepID=UPI00055FCCB7|nr:IclR family transcriptional regulator C-terminal domain-containing protein [Sphingobium herbicidovorans]
MTAIARELNINASTCFNILRTLAFTGVIDFDPVTRSYCTGLGAIDLANKALLRDSATTLLSHPRVQHLALTYGVTMTVFKRIGADRVTAVSVIEGTAAVRIHIRLGQRFPLLVGSSGRVWAAFGGLSQADIGRQWSAMRWHNQPDLADYLAQVALVAKRKIAIDDGDHVPGMFSASAPVFRSDGTLQYSLSAAWARGQHDKPTTRLIVTELKKIAAELQAFE